MASKLSEKIKEAAQNLRQKQQSAPAGGATEQAFQQATAAQGMAGTAAPSGQSNIQEVLGVQQQRAQGEQVAQQMEQQAEQVQVREEAQESEERQYETQQLAAKLEQDANYSAALDDQFNKYEQFSIDMDEAEEELALEELGFKLALKDKQYLANLDRMAKTANALDETAYKEEVANVILGEDIKNFRNQILFQEKEQQLDLNNREDLAKIDINAALAAGSAALREDLIAQEQAAWQQLGQAGADVAGSLYKKTPTTSATTTSTSTTPATTASTTRTTGIIPE